MRILLAMATTLCLGVSASFGQTPIKPSPEHEKLKDFVGSWDAVIVGPGGESKGTAEYKLECGDLWLTSTFVGDMGGMKFEGRGVDGYDTQKKKHVSVWFDSMSTTPMMFEGGYDEKTKSLTMTADGPGPDGQMTTWKSVNVMKDKDHFTFSMFLGDSKEPMMSIRYTRKKDK